MYMQLAVRQQIGVHLPNDFSLVQTREGMFQIGTLSNRFRVTYAALLKANFLSSALLQERESETRLCAISI
jgi:hypothetical protein